MTTTATSSTSSTRNSGNNARSLRSPKKYSGVPGIRMVCPRCGYEWVTFSTAPVIRCPGCGAYFRNPIYKALQVIEHRPSIEAEIYKMIMTETFITPDTLIKKGLATKAIYRKLKKLEREGKIKLIHIGKRIYIPVSQLPKIIQTSDIYLKQQEKEKKKQEETIQGPGVQLPAP